MHRRRVTPVPGGPVLLEGPVEIEMPDGSVVLCDRPVVALCTCRRSRRQPFCDTSHRQRQRAEPPPPEQLPAVQSTAQQPAHQLPAAQPIARQPEPAAHRREPG